MFEHQQFGEVGGLAVCSVYFLFKHYAEGCSLGEERWASCFRLPSSVLLWGLASTLLISAAWLSGDQGQRKHTAGKEAEQLVPPTVRCPQLSRITDPGVPVERQGWRWGPQPGISFKYYYRAVVLRLQQASESLAGFVKIDYWAPTPISNLHSLKQGPRSCISNNFSGDLHTADLKSTL